MTIVQDKLQHMINQQKEKVEQCKTKYFLEEGFLRSLEEQREALKNLNLWHEEPK